MDLKGIKISKTKKTKKRRQKGITLIALIVTIIIMLILSGVSIATLTGDNGVLQKATDAKEKNEIAKTEERIKLAVGSSYIDGEGKINYQKLIAELQKKFEEGNYEIDPEDSNAESWTITVGKAKVEIENENYVEPTPIENIITEGIYVKDNTIVTDSYGNSITIPESFKIATENVTYVDSSSPKVTEGIVIEDKEGNQFVWVPVGTVKNEVKTETIELKRYVFEADGTIDTGLSKANASDQLKTNAGFPYYYTEGKKMKQL